MCVLESNSGFLILSHLISLEISTTLFELFYYNICMVIGDTWLSVWLILKFVLIVHCSFTGHIKAYKPKKVVYILFEVINWSDRPILIPILNISIPFTHQRFTVRKFLIERLKNNYKSIAFSFFRSSLSQCITRAYKNHMKQVDIHFSFRTPIKKNIFYIHFWKSVLLLSIELKCVKEWECLMRTKNPMIPWFQMNIHITNVFIS